ncbi:MAG: Mbov_0401 family ICE element transposase-like protein [Spiroplasma sp.]
MQNNQFNSQNSFFDEYQKNSLIRIRNDLKNYFENVDKEIFLSSWRKTKGYIPDGFKSRTLITIFGRITYKRRVYKYWNKARYNYVFLADKKLQIEKYSRVTSHLKFKILNQIATGKRQRDICDMFPFSNISRVTISNIIKLFKPEKLSKYVFENINKIKIPKYLYINMDETFINLRKNKKLNKYRIRLVTFHTGHNEYYSTKKRKVLANKRVYWQLVPVTKKINTHEFMFALKRIARNFYSNIDDSIIIICGDGARWIREMNKYWPESKYILDKFHAIRYLKQIFSNKKLDLRDYHNSKNLFELGAYNDLIYQLKQIKVKPGKEEKLTKVINYFTNNAYGIINQKLEYNIGVSIESDVSHIVKWLLGYGSKTFNYQTFKNMLLLRAAGINNLDIISYLKEQYQLEKEEIKNFYWKGYWLTRKKLIS